MLQRIKEYQNRPLILDDEPLSIFLGSMIASSLAEVLSKMPATVTPSKVSLPPAIAIPQTQKYKPQKMPPVAVQPPAIKSKLAEIYPPHGESFFRQRLLQIPCTAVRMVLFNTINAQIFKEEHETFSGMQFAKRWLSGGIAGSLSFLLMHPMDAVLLHAQNAHEAQTSTLKHIVKNHGLLGMWKGAKPVSVFLIQATELGVYEHIKRSMSPYTNNYDVVSQFMGSFAAALSSSIIAAPIYTVARQRHQNSHLTSIASLSTIVRNTGIKGLYEGGGKLLLRKVIWLGVFFPLYERARLSSIVEFEYPHMPLDSSNIGKEHIINAKYDI